jgi:hypothetical protein
MDGININTSITAAAINTTTTSSRKDDNYDLLLERKITLASEGGTTVKLLCQQKCSNIVCKCISHNYPRVITDAELSKIKDKYAGALA